MADPKPNIGNIIPTGQEDGEVPSGNLTAPSSKRTRAEERAEEFLSLLVIPPPDPVYPLSITKVIDWSSLELVPSGCQIKRDNNMITNIFIANVYLINLDQVLQMISNIDIKVIDKAIMTILMGNTMRNDMIGCIAILKQLFMQLNQKLM